MRKDSPTPFGGGRTSPKKPRNLGLVAAVLAEQRRELEKERAQCKAQRRRLGTHVSILWELVQQSKQQLSDDLRFQQDAERCLEQLRQQRDDVMCPTPDLQRQLAQELENHGDCDRSGASEAFAGQYHCRLQEVQHLDRQPTSPEPADPQAANSLQEPLLEAQSITRGTPKPDRPFRHLESLSTGVRFSSPNDLLSTRASFLESLATAQSCSLDSTLSCSWASESEIGVSSTSAPILGTSSPHSPPLVPSTHRKPSDLQEESSENKPGQDYHELVRKSLELAKALQELICCYLQQRREVDEVVKWLEVKHAELIDLALGLPDRAGKLQETNLRAVSSPVPGESLEGLDLGQVFAHQRAQDLSEQAGALQAKDLEIEALRRECHLLQAHIAADLGSSWLPGGGATCVQWCNINDLDRVQCECQREVLCLQRQLTLHQSKASGPRTEACNLSSPSETARHQVQALERELGAQRRECEELSAQAATAERRRSSAKRRQRHKCRLC